MFKKNKAHNRCSFEVLWCFSESLFSLLALHSALQLGVKRRYIYRIYKYTHHNINMPPQLPCSLVMFPCAIWKHQIKCQLKTFWACLLILYFNMMLLRTTILCPKSVSLLWNHILFFINIPLNVFNNCLCVCGFNWIRANRWTTKRQTHSIKNI